MEDLSSNSFCFGTLYGFIAAGIIAMIANRMREAQLKIGSKDRPYDRFPDAAQPHITASGVVQSSRQEMWILAGLTVVLIIFIGLTLVGVFLIIG